MPNVFDKARKAEPKIAKAKKSDKREVQIDGLEDYAAVDATLKALKALTALAETQKGDLLDTIAAEFIRAGCEAKKRPDNFRGVDGIATASMELRKKSTNQQLDDAAQELLKKHNISFNADDELMNKVGEAIR